jgi:hypothetical protein
MISLTQLRTIPKIKPEQEKQEKLDRYLYTIERAIINAWRNHKASVIVDCENDIMSGHELKKYLKSKGFKVALTREYDSYLMTKVPSKIEIFFTEAEF